MCQFLGHPVGLNLNRKFTKENDNNCNVIPTDYTQLNSTRVWLNKGKEARKLKNIPDSLNDSQVFF